MTANFDDFSALDPGDPRAAADFAHGGGGGAGGPVRGGLVLRSLPLSPSPTASGSPLPPPGRLPWVRLVAQKPSSLATHSSGGKLRGGQAHLHRGMPLVELRRVRERTLASELTGTAREARHRFVSSTLTGCRGSMPATLEFRVCLRGSILYLLASQPRAQAERKCPRFAAMLKVSFPPNL